MSLLGRSGGSPRCDDFATGRLAGSRVSRVGGVIGCTVLFDST